MTMAIPVAKRVRDVFYKHRASGMIGHDAMFIGMVVAEMPYLLLMAVLYVFIYCATVSYDILDGDILCSPLLRNIYLLRVRDPKDWSLDNIWEFYVVCLFFFTAYSIVFLLCTMLHVSCER